MPPAAPASRLLGAGDVRRIADALGVRPTKRHGQNFVTDANTVRRIVAAASVPPDEQVLEIGPGLGSLTLGLLAAGAAVTAVEIDPDLAVALPRTVAEFAPDRVANLTVICADALHMEPAGRPRALVANLPYNVAVPLLLRLWETQPSLQRAVVMVQLEVADRLAAGPGSRVYGVPSVKLAWYADVRRIGLVSRHVFWPVPNVDSALLAMVRREPPAASAGRERVFRVVEAAFGQRRKMLRSSLSGLAAPRSAAEVLLAAGVPPTARAEQLSVGEFARIAAALAAES